MKKDIESRIDIESMVNEFYDKVKKDLVIGYIFNDVVKVNWESHLPRMYDFWENTILYTGKYEGNPMELHKHIQTLTPLTAEHFAEWNRLFIETVDGMFEGTNATLAKQRALSISTVMQLKILKPDS
ncbi:MAG: group III truncated hemoglobin [Ferruginibacter sp.]